MQSMATWRAPASAYRVDAKPTQPVARGLGWFSLALGALELFAPRALGRAIGRRRILLALVAVAGVTLLDVLSGRANSARGA